MKDITTIVEQVLRDHEDARDSDFRAIGWVIKITRPDLMPMSFSAVLWNHKALGLPSFESITRARRKLQHDKPELRGKVYEKRLAKQTEYIEKYARGDFYNG